MKSSGSLNPISYFIDKAVFFLALGMADTKHMEELMAQSGSSFLPGHFSFSYIFKTVVMNIIAVKYFRDVIVIIPGCIKNDMSRMYDL